MHSGEKRGICYRYHGFLERRTGKINFRYYKLARVRGKSGFSSAMAAFLREESAGAVGLERRRELFFISGAKPRFSDNYRIRDMEHFHCG